MIKIHAASEHISFSFLKKSGNTGLMMENGHEVKHGNGVPWRWEKHPLCSGTLVVWLTVLPLCSANTPKSLPPLGQLLSFGLKALCLICHC